MSLLFVLTVTLALPPRPQAQDTAKRGRKHKAPPATSHIEVTVLKKFNGKPISNAAVIFDATLDGKDQGNLEVKTDPEGKASIDLIPTGSTVRVQVIATGYATYAEEYLVTEPTRQISVPMARPQAQISSYEDQQRQSRREKTCSVQEPVRPTTLFPGRQAGAHTSGDAPAQRLVRHFAQAVTASRFATYG